MKKTEQRVKREHLLTKAAAVVVVVVAVAVAVVVVVVAVVVSVVVDDVAGKSNRSKT